MHVDPPMANAAVRRHLVDASWNDGAFAAQLVGIRRALAQGLEQGMPVHPHCWALSREAYDLCPDALYQYLVQCTLNGLWFDAPAVHRAGTAFRTICARTTVGWSLTRNRGQARAIQGANSEIGWIYVPFAWDDLMQLAVEGFLACLRGDDQRLAPLVQRLNVRQIEAEGWSQALPCWQGLVAKAAVGSVALNPVHEGPAIDYLLCSSPSLLGGLPHQRGDTGASLGNVLAHLAVAYTVAHETGHVMAARWHPDPRSALRQDGYRWEELADHLALRGLWNYNGVTAPHTNADDSEELLWLASGVFFYLGLTVYENGHRVASRVAGENLDVGCLSMEHIKNRFKSFVTAATTLAERLALPSQTAMTHAMTSLQLLLPAVIAYSNAYLDYCERTLPEAINTLRAAPGLKALAR